MIRWSLPLFLSLAVAEPALAGELEELRQKTFSTERDHECLVCHAGIGEEKAPKLDLEVYEATMHGKTGCIGCHADVEDPSIRHELEEEDLPPVDCGSCHTESRGQLEGSVHWTKEDRDGPSCADCHGAHDIRAKQDPKSRVHALNQLVTCGECHKDDRRASGHVLEVPEKLRRIVEQASTKEIEALMNEGLLVTASCTDCHGGHDANPVEVPASSLSRENILDTCGKCHQKARDEFATSIHAKVSQERSLDPEQARSEEHQPPMCNQCHQVHLRGTPESDQFRLSLVNECGTCHSEARESYEESYHGKATLLGAAAVAKCSDCHGSHAIKSNEDPASTVHEANKPETCRSCHEGAPDRFAEFWAHADYTDRENYPALFWVFVFMTTLLVSTFGFFGLHTVLWAIREAADAIRDRKKPKKKHAPAGPRIQRFTAFHRVLHLFVIISFLGLAATGAPLKFAHTGWARLIFDLIGGVAAAGWWHRLFAIITFGYFATHVVHLLRMLWQHSRSKTLGRVLLGPETMLPRLQDVKDVFNHMKWFVGAGPKPTWDRWTYWEKFDYWAVFWGVTIIGSSGLILWFPAAFATVLPGWIVNVALVVHSDEALLAIGFIFVVHFFNGHLRRSKFPMDPVIFTGSVPEEEYREERSKEVARLEAEGRLAQKRVPEPNKTFSRWVHVFGISAWIMGLLLMALIIHGLLTS